MPALNALLSGLVIFLVQKNYERRKIRDNTAKSRQIIKSRLFAVINYYNNEEILNGIIVHPEYRHLLTEMMRYLTSIDHDVEEINQTFKNFIVSQLFNIETTEQLKNLRDKLKEYYEIANENSENLTGIQMLRDSWVKDIREFAENYLTKNYVEY
jgi:5,10-methylene-tetrahydrofolate dehydrogenase/methenyl tetrahydrofolate cyclohydrolase